MTSNVTYLGIVERVPGSHFAARFPDFPDQRVRGDDLEQIYGRARAALQEGARRLQRAGYRLPAPTPASVLKADPDNRHGFLIKVEIPPADGRASG